jgi:hypothetical protein
MAIVVTWRDDPNVWVYGTGGNRTFHVTGTADEVAAITAVLADSDCPTSYEGVPRRYLLASAKSDGLVNADNAGASGWIVTVPYGIATGGTDETFWRLASTQASGRIIQSITGASTQVNAAGETMPVLSGYIGVDTTGQRTPTGVSIQAAAFAVSGRWVKTAASVTGAYLRSLAALMASPVNSDTFNVTLAGVSMSLAAGECLLTSLETPQAPRSDGNLEFSATILVSPNISSGTIFGVSGVTKKGWQYAEPYYKTVNTGNFLVPEALGVSVSDVYYTSSYSPIDGG